MSNPWLDDRVDKRFGNHGGEGGSYMNDNDWLVLAAHRGEDRPGQDQFVLSAWPAANCLRELRGDNHWVLCAAKHLDDVEVGLLHSVMIDLDTLVARIDATAGPRWMPAVRSAGG